MEVYHSDNSGNRVPPHPYEADPIAGSGQVVATGTAGDDKEFTVVGGATYAVTGVGTAVLLSTSGVTSTAAYVEWIVAGNHTVIIKIPAAKTTLYFEGDTSSKNVYIRRLNMP